MSGLTRYDFEKAFRMSAMEFFSLVCYIDWKNRKQEEEIRKFRIRNKIK